MNELISANFGVVLGGVFTLAGALLGIAGGLLGAYLSHYFSNKREREQRMFESRQRIYAELLGILDQPPEPSNSEKVEKTLALLNQAMLIAGDNVRSIFSDIWNSYHSMRMCQVNNDLNNFSYFGLQALQKQFNLQREMKIDLGIQVEEIPLLKL